MMKYRPIELRIKLFDEVRRLRGLGLSYREIIDEIERMYSVTLYPNDVYRWTKGINNPYINRRHYIPTLDYLTPSEELAYVIGVIAGDGYAIQKNRKKYNDFVMGVKVKDWEFAEMFAKCIGKILGRDPPKPRPVKDGVFVVEVSSRTLYELLKKPIDTDRIRQYIEHCIRCICAFLRGFFDSEGSIGSIDRNGEIRVYNSDKSLLEYIKELLHRLGIKTTGPKLYSKAGTPLKNPTTGKTYFTRKHCYYLYVPAESRMMFYELVGFTIKRKQQRLEEYLIRRGLLKKKEGIVMYQTA